MPGVWVGGLPIWASHDDLYWWLQTEAHLAPTSIQLLYPRFEGATLMSMVMEFQTEEAADAALRMMPYRYGHYRVTTRRQVHPAAKKAAAKPGGAAAPAVAPRPAAKPVAMAGKAAPPWRVPANMPPPPKAPAVAAPAAVAAPPAAVAAPPAAVAAPAAAVAAPAAVAEPAAVAAPHVALGQPPAAVPEGGAEEERSPSPAPLDQEIPPEHAGDDAEESPEMEPWARRRLRADLQRVLAAPEAAEPGEDALSSTTSGSVALDVGTEVPLPPNRADTPTVSSVASLECSPRQEEGPEWLELESGVISRAVVQLLGLFGFVF